MHYRFAIKFAFVKYYWQNELKLNNTEEASTGVDASSVLFRKAKLYNFINLMDFTNSFTLFPFPR